MAFVNYLNIPFGNYSVPQLIHGLNLSHFSLPFKAWLDKNTGNLVESYPNWQFCFDATGLGLTHLETKFSPVKPGSKTVSLKEVKSLTKIVATLTEKEPHNFQLIDTTAGLLNDTYSLLGLKIPMVAFEANALLALLIQVNLVLNSPITALDFRPEEFNHQTLMEFKTKKNILIYDPMFEMPKVKSLPSKEMQLLSLLSEHLKLTEVSENSWKQWRDLSYAVVVKRPDKGSYFLEQKPNYSVGSKLVRWDVYKN